MATLNLYDGSDLVITGNDSTKDLLAVIATRLKADHGLDVAELPSYNRVAVYSVTKEALRYIRNTCKQFGFSHKTVRLNKVA